MTHASSALHMRETGLRQQELRLAFSTTDRILALLADWVSGEQFTVPSPYEQTVVGVFMRSLCDVERDHLSPNACLNSRTDGPILITSDIAQLHEKIFNFHLDQTTSTTTLHKSMNTFFSLCQILPKKKLRKLTFVAYLDKQKKKVA
jgi:hypothetical protein